MVAVANRGLWVWRWCVVALLMWGACRASAQQGVADTMPFTIHATYYSDKFVGRKTANGEVFRQEKFTAAHKSMKFGTLLRVTNPRTEQSVIVKVNDRCPKQGVLDLTKRAAKTIGVGSAKVEVQILSVDYEEQWRAQGEEKELPEEKAQTKKDAQGMDPVNLGGSSVSRTQGTEEKKVVARPCKTSQESNDTLYYIQLATYSTRRLASEAIEKLPMSLRDVVLIEPDLHGHGVRVVTTTCLNMKEATQQRKRIQNLFSNAELVPCQNP